MADNTAKKAYEEERDPNKGKNDLQKLYMSYMTTPTDMSKLQNPENIIGQTAQGIKESKNVIPKILQGLGGVLRFANTGAGQNIMSYASGGDRFMKEAYLNNAQRQKEQEMSEKQQAASQDQARMGRVADYTLKQMEVGGAADANTRKEFLDSREAMADMAEKLGDVKAAAEIRFMTDPSQLQGITWSNPTIQDQVIAGFGRMFGINTGKGGNVDTNNTKYSQDVLDYAKQYKITPAEAQKIKNERTGGK